METDTANYCRPAPFLYVTVTIISPQASVASLRTLSRGSRVQEAEGESCWSVQLLIHERTSSGGHTRDGRLWTSRAG